MEGKLAMGNGIKGNVNLHNGNCNLVCGSREVHHSDICKYKNKSIKPRTHTMRTIRIQPGIEHMYISHMEVALHVVVHGEHTVCNLLHKK